MDTASETSAAVAFGRFLALPHRRELLADGQPVKLGGRAFDVLLALIEARGAVITKDALMARIWPDRIVEENALQSQISALRTALGADRDLVRTVSGRGYQFIGEVRPVSGADENAGADAAAATKPASAVPPTNLPEPVSELIGRDEEIGEILNLAAAHRLVTLTGAGGIGKTRLALALARRVLSQFTDGVWVAELAPISDPALVPAALAEVAGIELTTAACSAERVANALSGKQLLFLLDNCEHVIDAAAAMSEALLRANPAAHVITTSREPLNGKWVYPVPPLAVPVAAARGQGDPSQYGAIRLFFETAKAAALTASIGSTRYGDNVTICRRSGGLTAIELAAARTAMLGIDEVAPATTPSVYSAADGAPRAPRHRSLRAALD
jgi:DNA-binding winged helix-turn-helix (wHTH) protein